MSDTLIKLNEIINRQQDNPAYISSRNRLKLAPFVLFDAGALGRDSLIIPWHPHSGVATITIPYRGDMIHQDSQEYLFKNHQKKHIDTIEKISSGSAKNVILGPKGDWRIWLSSSGSIQKNVVFS